MSTVKCSSGVRMHKNMVIVSFLDRAANLKETRGKWHFDRRITIHKGKIPGLMFVLLQAMCIMVELMQTLRTMARNLPLMKWLSNHMNVRLCLIPGPMDAVRRTWTSSRLIDNTESNAFVIMIISIQMISITRIS